MLTGSDNANSLVLRIDCGGKSLILPGDLEPPGTESLIDAAATAAGRRLDGTASRQSARWMRPRCCSGRGRGKRSSAAASGRGDRRSSEMLVRDRIGGPRHQPGWRDPRPNRSPREIRRPLLGASRPGNVGLVGNQAAIDLAARDNSAGTCTIEGVASRHFLPTSHRPSHARHSSRDFDHLLLHQLPRGAGAGVAAAVGTHSGSGIVGDRDDVDRAVHACLLFVAASHARGQWSAGDAGLLATWSDWSLLLALGLAVCFFVLYLRRPDTIVSFFFLPAVMAMIGLAIAFRDLAPFTRTEAVDVWRSVHALAMMIGSGRRVDRVSWRA